MLLQPWIPRLCLDLALDTSVLPQIIWKTVQSIDPHHRHKKFVQKTDATAAEESCNSERNCTEEEGRNTLSLEHILLLDSYSFAFEYCKLQNDTDIINIGQHTCWYCYSAS